MRLYLLSLLYVICCSMESWGAWSNIYLSSSSANDDHCESSSNNIVNSIELIPDCARLSDQSSFVYGCDDKQGNITFKMWDDIFCSSSENTEVTVGKSGLCLDESLYYQQYECLDEYEVSYSYLLFGIPLYENETEMGTETNPIIRNSYSPVVHCFKTDIVEKYHITSKCEKKNQEGVIRLYETGLCVIPIHSFRLKPGDIFDYGKYIKGRSDNSPSYIMYNGCEEQ